MKVFFFFITLPIFLVLCSHLCVQLKDPAFKKDRLTCTTCRATSAQTCPVPPQVSLTGKSKFARNQPMTQKKFAVGSSPRKRSPCIGLRFFLRDNRRLFPVIRLKTTRRTVDKISRAAMQLPFTSLWRGHVTLAAIFSPCCVKEQGDGQLGNFANCDFQHREVDSVP